MRGIKKSSDNSHKILFFLGAIFLAGIISTGFNATFNNYVDDTFGLGADQRGMLEFPRELPGLLATFIIGAIFFLGEFRMLALAVVFIGLGYLGLGYFSPDIKWMILFMLIWSTGQHVQMSLIEPAALSLSQSRNKGYVLGRVNGIRSAGIIVGTMLIWLLMGKLNFSYARIYLGIFVLTLFAAICYLLGREKNPPGEKYKFKIIFKKKYGLYYTLAALFGARKQLFLVFGPWLLIKLFNQQAADLARILFISSVIGIFAKPLLGKIIDRFGERNVLIADAGMILLISLIYAFGPQFLKKETALIVAYVCYVIDEILFSLRSARTTYLYKILDHPDDLTPSISVGISIEHIISMTAPFAAGILWQTSGFYWVFFIAGGIALLTGIACFFIPPKEVLNKE